MIEAAPQRPYEDYLHNTHHTYPTVGGDGSVVFASSEPGALQAFRKDPETGEVRQITHFPRGIADVLASPAAGDSSLVVLHDDIGDERYQLSLVRDSGGPNMEIAPLTTDSEVKHLLGSWSPDGQSIAYTTNRRGEATFTVEVRDLASDTVRTLGTLETESEVTGFTPDGSRLIVMRWVANEATELLAYELGGNANQLPQRLTPPDNANYRRPAWIGDDFFVCSNREGDSLRLWQGVFDRQLGSWALEIALDHQPWDIERVVALPADNSLVVTTNVEGESQVSIHDATDLASRQGLRLPSSAVRDIVPAPDVQGRRGQFAFMVDTYATGGKIMMGDSSGAVREATNPTQRIPADEMVQPQLFHYESFDGRQIPCFAYRPHDEQGGEAVVYMHGGPATQFRPGVYNARIQHLTSLGYTVYAPNVRGSTGYGKEFFEAGSRRKRLNAIEDMHFLHRWIAEEGTVDPTRVALMGGSYGGYMVLAGLAFQPKLWAAGVATAAISDIETFLRNTAEERRSLREQEYGSLTDDSTFLAAVSPLRQAHSIVAPLLLLHGEHDIRVPLSEAKQMRDVLETRDIPVELVIYGDEGHDFGRESTWINIHERTVAFLGSVLRAA